MARFKKANVAPVSFVKEILSGSTEGMNVSDSLAVDMFTVGEYVDITGTTIGKGFQGGVKRWNWSRGPMSHGSMSHRAPGSIGVTDPPRVLKGKNLPGHMGNKKFTVQGLEIVDVDKENNLLILKGAVPGAKKNYLVINKSTRKKKKDIKPAAEQAQKKINPLKQSKKMMKK
jgi:large subunit ribosomal protein L3